MKVLDPRSLIKKEPKEITLNGKVFETFLEWNKMFKEQLNREPTAAELFYAGYILSNPQVRSELTIISEKEIKYDTRFN